MQKSTKYIIGLIMLAMLIGLGMYLNGRHMPPSTSAPASASIVEQTTNRPIIHAQRPPAAEADPAESAQETSRTRQKVEEYLRRHNRNAASLLAAFHALKDTTYLNEAATNFPNDPRVQWTVLARDAFPEDRRKWLDNFKTSSPSNSLANYLSAQDYFKNHQPEAAMKELTEAAGKLTFADYSMETVLDGEDLSKFSGTPPMQTYTDLMGAMASDLLPELSNLKGVANGIRELQQQYANAGDTASVQALAQIGIAFANRLSSGDSGKLIINQLVGMSSQAIVLESLDKNTSYDFLGGKTPAQVLAESKQTRAAFQEMNKTVGSAVPRMSEDQMANYYERIKIYGEIPAMRWLVQQTAATPNSGN